MIERDVTVTLTPEDIALYDRARAINLPTIVVSMYGDRIKMLLAEEREAVLVTINELMGSELDRNAMFSEGHDYALERIETFIRARSKT